MKHLNQFNVIVKKTGFAEKIEEQCGVNVNGCYQCMTCTLSCPVLSAMDYSPDQVVRMVQLEARDNVLSANTIWQCVSCEACVTRCPNEIDIPRLMDTLRQIALKEGVPGKNNSVLVFHRIFLNGIRRWGRQYELGMLLGFKLKTRDFFSDLGLGLAMLRKRKLGIFPGRNKYPEVKAIFRKLM